MATFIASTEIRNGAGAAASGTVTYSTGNALLALIGGFTTTSITGYTVTGGGTWTTDATQAAVAGIGTGFASNPSATGTSATVTSTTNGTGAAGNTTFVYEVSGMATSSILDVAGTATSGTASTTVTSPSVTSLNAADVFVSVYVTTSGIAGSSTSTGTGWTQPTGGVELDGTTFLAAGSAYKIVAATGAQTETWTINNAAWCVNTACYKQTGAAPAPPLPLLPPPVRIQYLR